MLKWFKIRMKKLIGKASHEEKVRLYCHCCNNKHNCDYAADNDYSSIKNAEIACDLENL